MKEEEVFCEIRERYNLRRFMPEPKNPKILRLKIACAGLGLFSLTLVLGWSFDRVSLVNEKHIKLEAARELAAYSFTKEEFRDFLDRLDGATEQPEAVLAVHVAAEARRLGGCK